MANDGRVLAGSPKLGTAGNLNLGGKTFNPDGKADSSRYFGKHILSQYVRQNAAKSLTASRERYESLYASRGENALEFYRRYASKMVRNYASLFSDASARRRLHRQITRFLGTETIDFVAIDGSCNKDPFNDFIVFSACAYGTKGQFELEAAGGTPRLRYRRWQLDRDVSMVLTCQSLLRWAGFANCPSLDRYPRTRLSHAAASGSQHLPKLMQRSMNGPIRCI